MKKYQIIYADPPWAYDDKLDPTRTLKYPVMHIEDIKTLPIKDLADDNCILFLWVTSPKLAEGLEVIKSWGFTYKTKAFCWVKTNSESMGLFWGMGRWTRSNTEDCLLATKGSPKRFNADIHQVLMNQILKHSHKPTIVRDLIVRLAGDLPRVELFARQKAEGWDCWGNEVESDIKLGE